jgi:predicted AAA+ superfamily ATPase
MRVQQEVRKQLTVVLQVRQQVGLYPQVFLSEGNNKIEELAEISSNYLYKDLFQFEQIKKPELLFKLLIAIALQTGSESSLNELAQLTATNVHTVKRYLDLLEKAFVIFRLNSFSRNLRKEFAKSRQCNFEVMWVAFR